MAVTGITNSMPSPVSADVTMTGLQMQKNQKAQDTLNLGALKNRTDIKAAAQDFEAVFIAQMLKPMFAGIETNTMFGGGKGEEIFRDLMIEEYGKAIAARDATGIQSHVMDKLIEIQAQHTMKE
ncbi:MAG: rod-binding protein [Alphaproteobacteria bacterium]